MNGVQRHVLWSSGVLTALTGAAYAAMRYLLEGDDPFSAYNHPLQPWALDGHLMIAPVLLFAIGWFWGNHVTPKLRNGRSSSGKSGRRSGLLLLGLAATMVMSGYLLQTVAEPFWRSVLAWTHGAVGTLFTLFLVGHVVRNRREASSGAPG